MESHSETRLPLVNQHLRGKSQPYELSKKESNFDIDEAFWTLKMIARSFWAYHIEKKYWMLIILCLWYRIEMFSNLLRLKFGLNSFMTEAVII